MAKRFVGLCLCIVIVSGELAGHVAAQDQAPAQGPVSRAILPAAAANDPSDFPALGVPYIFAQQPIPRKKKEEPSKKEDPQLSPEELASLRPQQTAFAPIDNKPMLPDTNYFGAKTFSVVSVLGVNPLSNVSSNNATVVDQYSVLAPILTRGSFKVADNASPRPLDRVFFYYNYYNSVPVQVRASASTLTLSGSGNNRLFGLFPPGPYTLRQTLTKTLLNDPTSPPQTLTNTAFTSANVHQETIGFEKTFL
ncbi:MAG: hypothetical protein HY040_28150, partial [Planctomycetes bacterium]|nr:hypothetical protein [Planctomycetota bacterium]